MWILVVTLCVLALLLSIVPVILFALCLFARDLLIRAVHPLPRPNPLAEQLLPEPSTFVPLVLPETPPEAKSHPSTFVPLVLPETPPEAKSHPQDAASQGREQGTPDGALAGDQAGANTAGGTGGGQGQGQGQGQAGGGADVVVDIEPQATPGNGAATPPGQAKPGEGAQRWPLACAAENSHLASIPRRLVLSGIHSISLFYCTLFNRTRVVNQERLLQLVLHRPKGTPLITVSNHMSIVDDPFLWGQWSLHASEPKVCRWTLVAKDICFPNGFVGYFFRLAKCIPIDRKGGIDQPGMEEAAERLRRGDWLHIFPEGGITQTQETLRRLKWGLASLILKASTPRADTLAASSAAQGAGCCGGGGAQQRGNRAGAEEEQEPLGPAMAPPVILCVGHSGFETLMPEPKTFGKRAYAPLWMQRITIVVGEPFSFDIPRLQEIAQMAVQGTEPALADFGAEAVKGPSSEAGPEVQTPASAGTTGVEPAAVTPGVQGTAPLEGEGVESAHPSKATERGEAGGTSGSGVQQVPRVEGAGTDGKQDVQSTVQIQEGSTVQDEATRRLFSHITAEVRKQLWAVVSDAHRRQASKQRL